MIGYLSAHCFGEGGAIAFVRLVLYAVSMSISGVVVLIFGMNIRSMIVFRSGMDAFYGERSVCFNHNFVRIPVIAGCKTGQEDADRLDDGKIFPILLRSNST